MNVITELWYIVTVGNAGPIMPGRLWKVRLVSCPFKDISWPLIVVGKAQVQNLRFFRSKSVVAFHPAAPFSRPSEFFYRREIRGQTSQNRRSFEVGR